MLKSKVNHIKCHTGISKVDQFQQQLSSSDPEEHKPPFCPFKSWLREGIGQENISQVIPSLLTPFREDMKNILLTNKKAMRGANNYQKSLLGFAIEVVQFRSLAIEGRDCSNHNTHREMLPLFTN